MSALDTLLDALPRITLVVGKGGVGKTTCAVGIAASFAARGERTLIVSTDPAAALADVIGSPVGTSETPVTGQPALGARQLAASELRREFLDRWREVITEIIDRGTYLERGEVEGLVDAALPGGDEIFAVLALADLIAEGPSRFDRIVVDTAPTGHTVRMLALPETFRALVSMLDLMQEKHRFMVRALTHRYRRDRADEFLDEMRRSIDGLRAALADGKSVAAIVVTRPEAMVLAETERYLETLRSLGVHVAALIVNAASEPSRADGELERPALPRLWIPRAHEPPRGVEAIANLVARATRSEPRPTRVRPHLTGRPDQGRPQSFEPLQLTRPFTIVGGKGGVGKSTVACALAIVAADAGRGPVLLVSTDPAPSIADVLGETGAVWTRLDEEHEVDAVPGLVVRQMDAAAGFARLRDEYQDRIDAMFDALVGRGIDVARDRAVLRELLALAPPGVDELFALSIIGEALMERRFATVVIDPAPTGHLLQLLDMPAIALDWTHRLMRLMLGYRNVVTLGDASRDLLDFARRARAIESLLHDPARCGLVIVSLDEPIVRGETERLAVAATARGVDVIGLIWNRVSDARVPAPLPRTVARRQFCARDMSPPPIGGTTLREWSNSWRELDSVP
ncbi:MAG TPA: TRC40/GET3/ArsA family transport-energizing ATPase [Gemmatimonadaceae bacterium]|nr:TRC40/GET3/ArsA family transport-energizing ATPase [Gemmatimonadaceae bacterium]